MSDQCRWEDPSHKVKLCLRNVFRANCYHLIRECGKSGNLQKKGAGADKGSEKHILWGKVDVYV